MENSFKNRELKNSYSLKKYNEGMNKGEVAQRILKDIMKILQEYGKNGIAGMADLSEIGIDKTMGIKETDEGVFIDINGFVYKIVNVEDESILPDGNYYNIFKKKFLVKYNKGLNGLEYSPYRKSKKMIENETGKIFGEDDLVMNGFFGKIGKVLSSEKNRDPQTGIILDYRSEYEDMIGVYDIGIGSFEGEIKNKYGADNYVGFEGNGIFKLDNRVILIGNFTIEHSANTKKIFGTGKIIYPDEKEEIGSRGENEGLGERIYRRYMVGAIFDDSF